MAIHKRDAFMCMDAIISISTITNWLYHVFESWLEKLGGDKTIEIGTGSWEFGGGW